MHGSEHYSYTELVGEVNVVQAPHSALRIATRAELYVQGREQRQN